MKKTLKNFIENSSINAGLIRAVVRQSGGWKSFQETAQDIYNHGIDAGFSGWIYYTETCEFYAKNQEAIVALAEQYSDDCGTHLTDFVACFHCLDADDEQNVGKTIYGSKHYHDTTIANALAWFVAEEVARAFVNWSKSE